jgi:pilus assembly protein CpaB
MSINKRAVAAIAAVLLAILGIISLVAYANGAKERAFEGAELVSVLQVSSEVPAGTKAEKLGSSVSSVKLPKTAVPANALSDLGAVSGKVATATLVPGEVLVAERFGTTAEVDGGSKVTVPKGLQEMQLRLAPAQGLDGSVSAGDRVGVVASYDDVKRSGFAVNQVLVLDAAKSLTGAGDESGTDVVLRLAVSGKDAAKIAHASQFGHIHLTKQGKDADVGSDVVDQGDVVK